MCTVGQLFIDGKFASIYTLEDPVLEILGEPVSKWKVPGKSAIPYGDYRVIINHSTRFKRELPLLLDVDGFDGVRMHPGNRAEDTEGCILVGKRWIRDSVLDSCVAFNELFTAMRKARGIDLTITFQTPMPGATYQAA